MVVALTALHLYPIVYFNVQAALAGLNPEMEEAARSLGCRGLRLFRKITLPSILPSVFAAASIVFIWAFTELGVPLMCDYQRVTSVQIFSGLKDLGRNPFVYALVVVVLVDDGRVLRVRAGGWSPARAATGSAAARACAAHRPRRLSPGPARWPPPRSRPSSASPRSRTSASCCSRSRATGTARSCRPA